MNNKILTIKYVIQAIISRSPVDSKFIFQNYLLLNQFTQLPYILKIKFIGVTLTFSLGDH